MITNTQLSMKCHRKVWSCRFLVFSESVLQINNAYTYHFRTVALSQAVGTTEDQGKMVLNCDVRISHDHVCLFNMELQNCAVTASGGEPESEISWIDQQPLPDLSK